jgi:hypothetical protein
MTSFCPKKTFSVIQNVTQRLRTVLPKENSTNGTQMNSANRFYPIFSKTMNNAG